MKIIDNKALLLKIRDPGRITTIIPKSKLLDTGEVLVNWGMEETQVLKNLKIKNVPSPILGKYKWPGLYRPFDHQKTTAAFLTLHRRAFCFNEQGTGKTGSVIWAVDYLMSIGMIKRVLILCPLSIMQSAWQNDLFRFAMHRTTAIAHSHSREKRIQAVQSDAEFVICNFDGLDIIQEAVREAKFDLIVIDECFVAGTLVSTPQGQRPIEQLQANDEVLTSNGAMRINRLVRNITRQLVEVKLENGETIRSTPDHPFFTDAGWVCAKNLTGRRLLSSTSVSHMRTALSLPPFEVSSSAAPEQTAWSDLLEVLRSEEVPFAKPGQELLQQYAPRATGNVERNSAQREVQSEYVGVNESERPQTIDTRGQRGWDNEARAVDFRGFTCGMDMELPYSVGQEAARLSYELQAGLCAPRIKAGVGGRWEQPQYDGPQSTRPQERVKTSRAWVESVAYIECPDGEAVYNLEVEGTPNYFVGDHYLVHNCNAYKTVATKRWKVLNSIIDPNTWVWMMTGTPASQSPTDAYGLARIVNPAGVPKFFGAFRELVMQKITNFKWVPRPRSEAILHEALQPAIRFTKEECLDLPPMTFVTRDVPLTPQQLKYYETLRKHMVAVAAGEEITTVNAAANLNKLLQISGGACYTDTGEVIEFDSSPRMNVLKEVIDEASHKVIVFVPFKHTIQIIYQELTKCGYACAIINGAVSAGKRTEIFAQFQTEDNPRVLIVQPQAASHGVTLTAADVVVYWSPVMSVETYLQCNSRPHRAGQNNPVTIVHLQGAPVEKRMYAMLEAKIDIHSRVVDMYQNLIEEKG